MRKKSAEAVGVIGLGIIGQGVARHLRSQSTPVFVWSRSPKPFPNFLGSVGELAQTANLLQLFVTDAKALRAVVTDLLPALEPRHIVAAHPTIEPTAMIQLAREVEATGAVFLEAPFTGSKLAAEGGQLVYYVSGPETALKRAKPLLERSARLILPTGAYGAASVLKIATNLITAASIEALAEALAIVRASGLDGEMLGRALEHNAARSGAIDLKLPKMLSGDYSPHFSLRHMLKDSGLALSLGEALNLNLPVTSATAATLFEGVRKGWGDEDFAVLARHQSVLAAQPAQPRDTAGKPGKGSATKTRERGIANRALAAAAAEPEEPSSTPADATEPAEPTAPAPPEANESPAPGIHAEQPVAPVVTAEPNDRQIAEPEAGESDTGKQSTPAEPFDPQPPAEPKEISSDIPGKPSPASKHPSTEQPSADARTARLAEVLDDDVLEALGASEPSAHEKQEDLFSEPHDAASVSEAQVREKEGSTSMPSADDPAIQWIREHLSPEKKS